MEQTQEYFNTARRQEELEKIMKNFRIIGVSDQGLTDHFTRHTSQALPLHYWVLILLYRLKPNG